MQLLKTYLWLKDKSSVHKLLQIVKNINPLNATGANMHQILMLTEACGIERVKWNQLHVMLFVKSRHIWLGFMEYQFHALATFSTALYTTEPCSGIKFMQQPWTACSSP